MLAKVSSMMKEVPRWIAVMSGGWWIDLRRRSGRMQRDRAWVASGRQVGRT